MEVEFLDKRKDFLSSVSIAGSTVIYDPSIIFIFGGKLPDVNKGEDPDSVRACLLNYILVNNPDLFSNIELAENFKDWIHDAKYNDLLSFETDLAQLSSLIILILESPGAIGELGAFCVNDEIKEKLLVLLSEDHYKEDSFIKLGLLRQLGKGSVLPYSWCPNDAVGTISKEYEFILSDILDHLDSINKSEIFNEKNNGHVAFLIYEIIRINRALILKEIKEYLVITGVDIPLVLIKKLIFLLEKTNLIEERCKGKQTYYLTKSDNQRIKFIKKDKRTPLDLRKAITDATLYYSQNDKRRFKLIQEELKSRKVVK